MLKSKTASVTILLAAAIILVFIASACSGGDDSSLDQSVDQGRINPTWIAAQAASDTVSVFESEVDSAGMAHFKFPSGDRDITFMAYTLEGETQVRANVCPPCRSVGFTLEGDELVCDSCSTRFSAVTGDGINGACEAFPKASVDYERGGERIVMQMTDLVTAYENTTKPGWP